jgi:hypothetical protein
MGLLGEGSQSASKQIGAGQGNNSTETDVLEPAIETEATDATGSK